MRIKPRRLSDEQLLAACRDQASKGTTLSDGTLAAERREVSEYYLGQRPLPMREGGSKFVSQDVYLSVETMKAEIVETFGAGSQIVQFSPQGGEDIGLAKHATAYCEYAVHRKNDGILIFQDVVHDALTARVGFAKVSWDKREEVDVYRFDGPVHQAQALLQKPNVRLIGQPKATNGPEGPSVAIEYEVVTDCSQVEIETVPPEEIVIAGRTRKLSKVRYIAHRYRTSLGELVADGYDPEKVYSITGGDDELAVEEESTRRELDVIGNVMSDDDFPDEASRMVTAHESYIRIDALGTGSQQLWKVVHVGDTLLEKQRVSDHPFLAYIPQPIPHTFWGNNFASRTMGHANVKTTLTRAIVEQAVDATNPRWQVARGGVANPRELIDNRRGGIVNVRSVADSVAPLTGAPINPLVMQTIGMIDSDREDTTGISRLSQGLDKKALSHQNSQGLVEGLADASRTRTKVIARNFALQFVSQLYLKVYKLALENEKPGLMLEIGGTFAPIDPSAWASKRDVKVDMSLGYGERDQTVAERSDLHSALSKDPKMGRIYGEQQAYNLWRETLEIKGYRNVGELLTDPSTMEPPKPDPEHEAKVAKLLKETDVLERQQALREAQVQDQIARENAETEWKRLTSQHDQALKQQDADRKDRETDNRIDIGLAELELAISAGVDAAPENTKLTAIASPNS